MYNSYPLTIGSLLKQTVYRKGTAERPVAIVCLKQGMSATEGELRTSLDRFVDEGKIAKFWIPEKAMIQQTPIPKTSTGKLDKKPLRIEYAEVLLGR